MDEGPRAAPPVLLMHGEPTFSYFYRKMIPVFLEAGLRVVAPDLVGFGRSDKPASLEDYTYARHVGWMRALLFDHLELEDATLFCQDWGGLVGLCLVAEHPARFSRVCASNTGLPDGSRRLPEAWWRFHDFVQKTPDLPIGMLVRSGCAEPLADEVLSAYDAPFPGPEYKAGARAFSGLIPQTEDDPATPDNRRAWASLERFDKPFLCAFGDSDPITRGADRPLRERIPGAKGQPHAVVEGGGHFVQEDPGRALAELVVRWMRS